MNLVFATLSSSTGNLIGNSYASSDTTCTDAYDIRININKVYALGKCSVFKIFIYDSITNSFNILESSTSIYRRFVLDFTGDK